MSVIECRIKARLLQSMEYCMIVSIKKQLWLRTEKCAYSPIAHVERKFDVERTSQCRNHGTSDMCTVLLDAIVVTTSHVI